MTASTGETRLSAAPNREGQQSARRLGRLLTELNFISQDQLAEAELELKLHGGFLAKVLVEKGYISEPKLMLTLVKECRVPHIRLTDYSISESVADLIPENVCLRHGMLPIDLLGHILTVAMVDPLDTDALDTLRRAFPSVQIKPILCSWSDFHRAAQRLFPNNPAFEHAEFSFAAVQLYRGTGGFGGRTAFGESSLPPVEEIPDAVVKDARKMTPVARAYLDALETQLRETIVTALHDLPKQVAAHFATAAPAGVTPQDAAKILQEVAAQAFEALLDSLQREVASAMAHHRRAATSLSELELTELLRSSFAAALNASSADLFQSVTDPLRSKAKSA